MFWTYQRFKKLVWVSSGGGVGGGGGCTVTNSGPWTTVGTTVRVSIESWSKKTWHHIPDGNICDDHTWHWLLHLASRGHTHWRHTRRGINVESTPRWFYIDTTPCCSMDGISGGYTGIHTWYVCCAWWLSLPRQKKWIANPCVVKVWIIM